jgi:hypothetical protein
VVPSFAKEAKLGQPFTERCTEGIKLGQPPIIYRDKGAAYSEILIPVSLRRSKKPCVEI